MSVRRAGALAATAWIAVSAAAPQSAAEKSFSAPRRADAIARITVVCDACAWDTAGREAAILQVILDGRTPVRLPIVRSGRADYSVLLGALGPGPHVVRVAPDAPLSASGLPPDAARVDAIEIRQVDETDPEYVPLSLAPVLHARPNTIGRFTDVPVFMWYEVEPDDRGVRYRYSVVFTNEDGGTPADRLMATWGRTTDIEYVYSALVDPAGRVLEDDIQGPGHEILPFRGSREGRHPLLWVATDNNMVEDRGTTTVRYAPAPVAFPLRNVSREAVMDAHPWLYAVAARELAREGKIAPGAPPGTGVIPDPRRFVYVEACGDVGGSALGFLVRVGNEWVASDRGVPAYRIVRSGCFRAAIPLPADRTLDDVTALRVHAFERPAGNGDPAQARAPVRLTRINRLFTLDENHEPGPSRLRWEGLKELVPDGSPAEFAVP